jgi:hypothetical protein
VTDIGEAIPEFRSGDVSDRMVAAFSNMPVALALEDPTAGAALVDSEMPTWCLCMARKAEEFAVETTDSAGLPGLSKGGVKSGTSGVASVEPEGVDAVRCVDVRVAGLRAFVVPLMVARRLLRSSNGAPVTVPPGSMLFLRLPILGDPGTNPREEKSETLRCAKIA